MSSAERPEADVAEQSRSVGGDDEQQVDRISDAGAEAPVEDVLDQMRDAGVPDEDEAPHAG